MRTLIRRPLQPVGLLVAVPLASDPAAILRPPGWTLDDAARLRTVIAISSAVRRANS
jgi:hypothetical protein